MKYFLTLIKSINRLISKSEELVREHLFDQAIPILDNILELDHTEYKAYSMRGFCRLKKQLYEESLSDFENLISIYPESINGSLLKLNFRIYRKSRKFNRSWKI
jgi:tetratricopeptide (TPR) repeat protein